MFICALQTLVGITHEMSTETKGETTSTSTSTSTAVGVGSTASTTTAVVADAPLYRVHSKVDIYRSQFDPQVLPHIEPYRCKRCGYFDDDDNGLCPNHTGGSKSIATFSYDGFSRMRGFIGALAVKCGNWRRGCEAKMGVFHLLEHANCCKFRGQQCDDCGDIIDWCYLEENHKLGRAPGYHHDCELQLSTCPKCQLTMFNFELKNHHATASCEWLSSKTLSCKYGRLSGADNCCGKFTYKELMEHNLRFLQPHLDATWAELLKRETTVGNLTSELDSVNSLLVGLVSPPAHHRQSSSVQD